VAKGADGDCEFSALQKCYVAMAKLSIKLPKEMYDELQEEAIKQDRTMNWIIRRAWVLSRDRIKSMSKKDRIC
jgi:uncharacterized small protein (TIGR04563 family)